MATIAADQGAQGRARLSASDTARKDFAKNLRELLAVAEEARSKGFAYKPEIRRQLELTRTVIIAQNYFKTAGNAAAVSDADVEAFFKESGQESRFQEFINEMKAQDPSGAQQIPEEQMKQARHQWGQVMLGERRGIEAGIDKKRNVELQILLQQSRLLAEAYAQENLNPEKNPGMKATDAEIDAYLKAHLEDQVHARHILIAAGKAESPDAPSPAAPSDKDKAQARATAEQVLKRARAGEDFAALAKQYSSDPGSKDKGGDLGWFAAGQMVPEFDKAAFVLQPGQISEIVETQFGFHIIKVEERRMGEKDRNQVRETIEQEKGKKWVEDVVKRSHVTVADNYTVEAPPAQPPTSLFAPGGPPEGPAVAPETDKNPKPATPKATNKKR
jgi:parvulin-like peptidyl-prolyl isomerase